MLGVFLESRGEVEEVEVGLEDVCEGEAESEVLLRLCLGSPGDLGVGIRPGVEALVLEVCW